MGAGLVRRLVCLDLQPNVCVGRSGCKTTEAGAGDDLARLFDKFGDQFSRQRTARAHAEMAMFNATLLCITSFIYIRGIFDKAIVNLLPCFSWHFWKRSLPWLQAERGTDLGHLLFVMLLQRRIIHLSAEVSLVVI